jgi:aryl-alcohol dehydrogenase-like predicted oxidoreductase
MGGEQGDTEEILGRWFGQGGGRRDAVVLATKVFNPVKRKANLAEPNTDDRSLSAYKIRKHCEGSLKRLQTDHLDLYQMHHVDRDCPWDEIWQGFEQQHLNRGSAMLTSPSNRINTEYVPLLEYPRGAREPYGLPLGI